EESLLAIGPKQTEQRLIEPLTAPRARLILYSTIGLLPLTVLLAGAVVWWRRR
ncbi:MAG: ABC transporter, partial [Chloroflexi bacterium]|nr:ABC transporter [Chloroflexota bacterium]